MSARAAFFEVDQFILVGDTGSRPFPKISRQYLERAGKKVHAVDLGGASGYLGSLDEAPAGIEAAIIEVAKERTAEVVGQALAHGARRVWIHQMTDTDEAVELCRQAGAEVFTGNCAVMYVSPTFSPHALHRGIWKLLGRY